MMSKLRRRLLPGVVAAVLATGAVVPGGARPAQAAVDPATVQFVTQFALTAFGLFRNSQNGGLTLEQATAQIISAVRSSGAQIQAHMDALAIAETNGCVAHHVLEFVDSPEWSLSLKQRWAQDVTSCVTQIDALWNAIGQYNYAGKQQLALNLGILAPIALTARAQAQFSTEALQAILVTAFRRVKSTFTPNCAGYPNVGEEFWQTYFDPIWLTGTFTCQAPGSIGLASETGVGLFQGGALLQYDRMPVLRALSSERSPHKMAVQALRDLAPIAGRTWHIQARHSGQLFAVSGASTADGAAVVQFPAEGADNGVHNERWLAVDAGNDAYRFQAVHSGKCLGVAGASTAAGAGVTQHTCTGGANQTFSLTPQDWTEAYYNFHPSHSGLCIVVAGSSQAADAPVQQAFCQGQTNQHLKLIPA
jgi:Ricin-type beta-trefoil lectin domain-like